MVKHFKKSVWLRAAIAAGVASCSAAMGAAAVTLSGHPADYEAQRQQVSGSPATVSATGGSAEELQAFARDTDGFLFEEGRPIFQFDLSTLDEPAQSAHLNLELLGSSANEPFAVEVWGVDSNRSGPLTAGDPGAAGEFGASGYTLAHDAGETIADETTATGAVSQDVTLYLNNRYDEFEQGGDSWIYLRLQSTGSFGVGSGVDAALTFASADHTSEVLRPFLDIAPIPEPRHAALLLAVIAALLISLRRRRAEL